MRLTYRQNKNYTSTTRTALTLHHGLTETAQNYTSASLRSFTVKYKKPSCR